MTESIIDRVCTALYYLSRSASVCIHKFDIQGRMPDEKAVCGS